MDALDSGTYVYEYPRPAVACDTVVIYDNGTCPEVLLIQRKHNPFKGYWAFPGGFLDMNETCEIGALRELREETGIVLDSLSFACYADDPCRDTRGRVIGFIFYKILDYKPDCVAQDDAEDCKWFAIDRLPSLAFDHDLLIQHVFRVSKISSRIK